MGADGNNMTSMRTGHSEMSVRLASNEAPKAQDPMTTWQRLLPVRSSTHRLDTLRAVSPHTATDAGFTLIELMVVLLILAILLAIAIPTFLGVTKSANDRAAQSNLNTAMLNAKAAYQSNSQTYTGVSVATLSSAEPSLSFIAGASTGQGVISVNATDGHAIVLAAFSKSNNCWYQIDNPSGSFQTVAAPFTATAASVTGSGSNSPMASPTNPSAGSIFFPTVPGTVYVEVKGDSTTADCNALTPAYHGTSYQWTTTGFPSI